jgi:hypothetical protein
MINSVEPIGKNHRFERDVVVTLTLNVEGVVALKVTLGGTVQTAPVGAPEQESEAAPLIPAPPIDIAYVAVEPAVTVAVADPPEATPSPTLGGAPDPEPDPPPEPLPPPEPGPVPLLCTLPLRVTVCGLFGALSAIVSAPVCVASEVGVYVT